MDDDIYDIIKIKNFNENSKLENILQKTMDNNDNFFSKPTVESDYDKMRRLASEEDDFSKVIEVFSKIIERIGYDESAIGVLRESHEVYILTQTLLAAVYAEQGQFDYTEEHLKNAHLGCELNLGMSRKVVLESRILEDKVNRIVDDVIRNTNPQFFMDRVSDTSKNGNYKECEKYIALSLRSLKEHGILRVPNMDINNEVNSSSSHHYETFFSLNSRFKELLNRAYCVATIGKLNQAIGYAVSDNIPQFSKDKISNLQDEAKDIMLDMIKKYSHTHNMSQAFDGVLTFFNGVINPMCEELMACCDDNSHPLRTLYKPRHDGGQIWAKIVGSERIKVESTAIVPQTSYVQWFRDTNIRIPVHPFYNHLLE